MDIKFSSNIQVAARSKKVLKKNNLRGIKPGLKIKNF